MSDQLNAAYLTLEALARELPEWRNEAFALQATIEALQAEAAEANGKAENFRAAYEALLEMLTKATARLSTTEKAVSELHAVRESLQTVRDELH